MPEKVLGAPYKTRTHARRDERGVQQILNGDSSGWRIMTTLDLPSGREIDVAEIPPWARGVKVERAGAFQFVLSLTSWRGH